jgi:hypothetical protein
VSKLVAVLIGILTVTVGLVVLKPELASQAADLKSSQQLLNTVVLFLLSALYCTLATYSLQGAMNRILADDWDDALRGEALVPGLLSFISVLFILKFSQSGFQVPLLAGFVLFGFYQILYFKKIFPFAGASGKQKATWFVATAGFFLVQNLVTILCLALGVGHAMRLLKVLNS